MVRVVCFGNVGFVAVLVGFGPAEADLLWVERGPEFGKRSFVSERSASVGRVGVGRTEMETHWLSSMWGVYDEGGARGFR